MLPPFLLQFLIEKKKRKKIRLRFRREHIIPKKFAALFYYARTCSQLQRPVDDEAFERLFRFDKVIFSKIEERFSPFYERLPLRSQDKNMLFPWTNYGRPRRRLFSAREALLMLLRHLASKPHSDDLSLLSGCLQTTESKTLAHALHCLLSVLKSWKAARMCLPKSDEFAHALSERARCYVLRKRGVYLPGNIIGVIDGSIIQREQSGDENWQHTNHNGKSNSAAAKILLIQLFDGTYGPAVLNYIGSAHDAKLASLLNINSMLSHLHPTFMLISDSAFGTSSRVVCPMTEGEMRSLNSVQLSEAATAASLLSLLRECSEWGIGGVENTFQILREALPADDLAFGWMVWETCLRLFNVRVRLMGKGQTFSVYAPMQ